MTEISDILVHLQRFSVPDYVVFVAMFVLCILIGIYFGFFNKSDSEDDYLVGGRNMSVFPIGLSLIASFISGITLLGLPTEVYSYGIQYVYVFFGVMLMGVVVSVFYLPVFRLLNITSTYEYLESRFDRRLRMFGSIMFTIMNIGFLPIVIYVPALAFNQVTGVDIHIITPIVCIVCIFYTCVGGMKAVVWTDVVQTFSMIGALLLVAVKGTIDIGGPGKVFEKAIETERIELPDLSFNPILRHTIWSQVIGGVFYWTQTGAVSQNMIQRYLSLPTLKDGRKAMTIFVCGVFVIMFLCSYNGLLIYATYEKCDPLSTKLAKVRDQLLPLFVLDTLSEYPGLAGLFIAGVFSAALSSLSTCLNSMSAVVLEDFVKPFVNKPLSDRSINWIMRSVVVAVGIICLLLVNVVEKMGTVLQLTMSLESITNGPLLGVFTIGIFLPWIKSNSALSGGVFAVFAMSWISLKAQWAIASGGVQYETKQLTTEGCTYKFNAPPPLSLANITAINEASDIFPLYKMSYMWYTCLGTVITIIVALLLTPIFGHNRAKDVHPSLITPIVRNRINYEEEKDAEKVNGFQKTQSPKLQESAL
ncbi:hypothetical protein ACFFRR_000805 [Megaselia abdita]